MDDDLMIRSTLRAASGATQRSLGFWSFTTVLKRMIQTAVACLALVVPSGCGVDTLLNQTATFGSGGATELAGAPLNSGLRGTFSVFIENNTPFRAIFTTGVFDNTDEQTTPIFFQFSPNSQITPSGGNITLEGNRDTGIIVFPCARVFSVGSRSLINLVAENTAGNADTIDEAALLDGVGFSSASFFDADSDVPREQFAAGFEALLGVDFNCGSLLNLSLEFAEFGPDRFVVSLNDVFPARGEN
jgi:hypothetical protein